MINYLFSLFLIFLSSTNLCAETVIVNEDENKNINKKATYFIDKSGDLTVATISKFKNKFEPIKTENLVLDIPTTTAWIKIKFNNIKKDKQKVYLSFTPSYLGEIEIYDLKNKNKVSETGALVNSTEDNISSALPAPLELTTGFSEFYIKIKSVGLGVSINLKTEDRFLKDRSKNELVFSFIVGALSILVFYHLFIFITSRNIIYLYYVMYMTSMVFFQFAMTGFNRYFYFEPYTVFGFSYGYLGSLLAGNFVVFFMIAFSYNLLELKKESKKIRYPLIGSMIVAVITSLILITTQHWITLVLTRLLALSTIISLITISGVLSFRKNKSAQFYLLSWTPILIGATLLILSLSGAINESFYTTWAMPAATILESLFLAIAIGNRLEIMTREKLKEQNLKVKAYEQLKENFNKMKTRDKIIRTFVSPTILTEVALGKDPLLYEPKIIDKTILFTDLRSYTSMTEKNSLDDSFQVLNEYFTTLNDTIFKNQGEVDKLIGDAVMATFNTPESCLKAIVEFQNNIAKTNKKRLKLGKPLINFGTGVSYGQVLSANFGSRQKLDRTIVGDAVNTASRYESLTKVYKVKILVTESFLNQVKGYKFSRPIDIVQVKGRSKSEFIFEIFEHESPALIEFKLKTKKILLQAIADYATGLYRESLFLINGLIEECKKSDLEDNVLYVIKDKLELTISHQDGEKNGQKAS